MASTRPIFPSTWMFHPVIICNHFYCFINLILLEFSFTMCSKDYWLKFSFTSALTVLVSWPTQIKIVFSLFISSFELFHIVVRRWSIEPQLFSRVWMQRQQMKRRNSTRAKQTQIATKRIIERKKENRPFLAFSHYVHVTGCKCVILLSWVLMFSLNYYVVYVKKHAE
mgnify:CR=1 FL=1